MRVWVLGEWLEAAGGDGPELVLPEQARVHSHSYHDSYDSCCSHDSCPLSDENNFPNTPEGRRVSWKHDPRRALDAPCPARTERTLAGPHRALPRRGRGVASSPARRCLSVVVGRARYMSRMRPVQVSDAPGTGSRPSGAPPNPRSEALARRAARLLTRAARAAAPAAVGRVRAVKRRDFGGHVPRASPSSRCFPALPPFFTPFSANLLALFARRAHRGGGEGAAPSRDARGSGGARRGDGRAGARPAPGGDATCYGARPGCVRARPAATDKCRARARRRRASSGRPRGWTTTKRPGRATRATRVRPAPPRPAPPRPWIPLLKPFIGGRESFSACARDPPSRFSGPRRGAGVRALLFDRETSGEVLLAPASTLPFPQRARNAPATRPTRNPDERYFKCCFPRGSLLMSATPREGRSSPEACPTACPVSVCPSAAQPGWGSADGAPGAPGAPHGTVWSGADDGVRPCPVPCGFTIDRLDSGESPTGRWADVTCYGARPALYLSE